MENLILIEDLKNKGHRITKARKALLSVLSSNTEPVSVGGLLSNLLKKDVSVNKTTVYRELEFLSGQGIVHAIEFGDGKKRYELNRGTHHHHIVCVSCGAVVDIDFDVDLARHEKEISEQSGFDIKEHSIEFFGLCKTCK